MPITTWNRLECDVVHEDPLRGLEASLEAQLADPLWLLARQWQLGELRGEDAGSPVLVKSTLASHAISELVVDGKARPLPIGVPLEALVEPEPVVVDVRLRVRAGEYFTALLLEHDLARLAPAALAAFGWATSPPDGHARGAFVALAAPRWPDGVAIDASLARASLVSDLQATTAEAFQLTRVANAWRAWWDDRAIPSGHDSWRADHLDHAFELRATTAVGQVTLAARSYPGGRIDWDDFEVVAHDERHATAPTLRSAESIPLGVDIPGMPVRRFWELEDPRFDVGRVSLGPGDLGAALLVETALTYGNDWFLVAAPLAVGALHRVTELVVVDTFGVAAPVRPVEQVRPDATWALWRLTTAANTTFPYLFVPAATPATVEGELLEEVALVRDELANVVWGIEQITADDLDRGQRITRAPAAAPVETRAASLVYRPLPTLPGDRVPLVRDGNAPHAVLRHAQAVDPAMAIPSVMGTILNRTVAIRDDEVGREGLVLTRRWQAALDVNGTRWTWRARAKTAGSFLAGVRLAFDEMI
jgi:hypothetical protein